MSSDCYHLLDANVWKEMFDKKIQENGYVYVGRKLAGSYDVKVFVKEKEKTND